MLINLILLFLVTCFSVTVNAQGGGGTTILNPRYVRTPVMTCKDIKYIVDFHNNGRRSLANGTLPGQPKAANMEKMVWDPKLAEIATNWTKQMIFGHNPLRKDPRFSVGENLFMSASSNNKSTTVEWKRAVSAWFNEYVFYEYQPAYEDPITAHYTQMIWADVVYVGCSTTHFLDSRNWLYKYYVCNYGPAGNWYGDYPYAEDYGVDEYEILLELGLIDDTFVNFNCDDLCCDVANCSQLYGPNCPTI